MGQRWLRVVLIACLCIAMEHFGVQANLSEAEKQILSSAGELDTESHLNTLFLDMDLPGAIKKVLDSMIEETKECNKMEPYRRADGVCNNLMSPLNGAALHIQGRLLKNAYTDKVGKPRLLGKKKKLLPSPRKISQVLLRPTQETNEFLDPHVTQMSMQWGQYIDHDITFTAVQSGSGCCDNPDYEYARNGSCFPIAMSYNDRYFKESCMAFKRSFFVTNKGVHEQINGITSFVDASTVYGSSQAHQDELRTHKDGQLKVDQGNQLPSTGPFNCRKYLTSATHCPFAGDVRVNVFQGLTLLHLLFMREHNRLADKLAKLNSHWDDEKIFQETRKIIIALHQKITYEEYLPHVIGPKAMKTFKLLRHQYFRTNLNPNVLNEFSTAAFRFGHAQINKNILINGGHRPISELYFQPWEATDTEEQIVETMTGQCNERAQRVDNFMSTEVTDLLFLDVDAPGHSTDLGARNIQRGRDHGLQPFKRYQKLAFKKFGLKKWAISKNCAFKDVYDSVSDVDLFVGGLCEVPMKGALVGPTFAFIIGEQFKRIKLGDRFFFETKENNTAFQRDQRKEINKLSFAKTICRNTLTRKIQRDVFRVPCKRNKLIDCDNKLYDDIDLSPWKDDPSYGTEFRRASFTSHVSILFQWQRKGISSLLMAKACNIHSGEDESVIWQQKVVSMVSEMIHTASLIHDDVIDASDTRRSQASLNLLYGQRQLIDDLLDFTSSDVDMGKPTAADLKQGLATAPVLFAAQEFPELHPMIMRRFSQDGDVEFARNAVDKSKGVEQTRLLATQHSKETIRNVQTLSDSEARAGLIRLAQILLERKH